MLLTYKENVHSTQMYIPLKPLFSRHKGIGVQFSDEPTGNLDSNTSLQVIKTLVHINETLNKTVVMVTHDPKMASYGKKTFFLKDGVILDSLIKKESNEKYYEKILNKMVQI